MLCRHFGFDQIETAEDLTSETFLTAAQTWPMNGIPENPVAWLYTVAKNKTKNFLQRSAVFQKKIVPEFKYSSSAVEHTEIDLSPQNINDSQLQMMFAICHPAISSEAQVGLSLRILCGFGIEEIADAFLTNKETINKRLFRAKEKLREEKIKIELPDPSQINERLSPVLTTIYLLFNEGYYSVSNNQTLRKDLCFEAIRLCTMLVENNSTDKPEANALLALMYFHASRFDARFDKQGVFILYEDQDETLWDQELIERGGYFLHRSSQGNRLSKYHLEASIAYWHTIKASTNSRRNEKALHEKWENILQLYNFLLQIEYSPIAALNRTYALSKVKGKLEAIAEAEKLKLTDNHFYFALLGELYTGIDNKKAIQNFQKAFSLAKTETDKQTILKKIDKV